MQEWGRGQADGLTFRLTCSTASGDQRAERRYATYTGGTRQFEGCFRISSLSGTRTSFRHPDLIPETLFYRLRAFRGPASEPVRVTLPEGELTVADEDSSHDWLPAREYLERAVPGRPLRLTGAGAPTGFKALVKHANGILFTWTDRASDEEGFLPEAARARQASGYEPIVVLDPDINSTGLITLPTEKEASYRIRAFTYGERSNVVRLTTGMTTGESTEE